MENKEFIKTVHASILGDGFFYKVDQNNDRANTHFAFKQISDHEDYFMWLADYLDQLTRVKIDRIPAYIDTRGYNCKEQLVLKTMRHPVYKTMYNRLYQHVNDTHVKRLDPHYLTLFDSQTLAMMYMDDGWIEVDERLTVETYVRVSIATHCFTYFENQILRNLIAEKFDVHGEVRSHKQKSGEIRYFLGFKKDNAKRLLDIVQPHVFSSYEYKLKY